MKRILALDPGSKRIGVAVSDELGWTAQPLETFERHSLEQDVEHIRALVRDLDVNRVIMGMPFRMTGQVGPEAERVQVFQQQLEQALKIPVIAWDERLTSKSAESILIEANVSRKKRKGAIDRVAAAILLQSYLASLPPTDPMASPPTEDEQGRWDDR